MKISYSIEKHKPSNNWALWKNAESERSVGSHKVFSGTRKECREKLEEINGTGTRETKSEKYRTRKQSDNSSKQVKTRKKRIRKEVERKR